MEKARDILKAQQKSPTSSRAGQETNKALNSSQTNNEHPSSSTVQPEQPANSQEDLITSQIEANDARDFDFITQFLADGGADDRSDDEVWETLAKEVSLSLHISNGAF